MERTPIKIRGKKGHARKLGSRPSAVKSDSNGKRPLALTSGSSTLLAKHPHQPSSSSGSNVFARCSSRLEQLPTELLENIFFHCLNISLPQASPAIGHKLASTHVRSHLVFETLSNPGTSYRGDGFAGVFPTAQDLAQAQSAILRQKWLTYPFYRQLIPDYIVRTIIRELSPLQLQWMGDGLMVSQETESVLRQFLKDNAFRFDYKGEGRGLPGFWEVRCPCKSRGVILYLGIGLRDGLVTLRQCNSDSEDKPCDRPISSWHQWKLLNGVHGCQIPEKLLHGPWTEDKCNFLEVAVRGNAHIDWVNSTAGEVAKEGLWQAIREHNPQVITALLTRTDPEITEEQASVSPLMRKSVGIIPQHEHLRAAILEEGCPKKVVIALLMAEEVDFNFQDSEIHHWINEKIAAGNEIGEWLRKLLQFSEDW